MGNGLELEETGHLFEKQRVKLDSVGGEKKNPRKQNTKVVCAEK